TPAAGPGRGPPRRGPKQNEPGSESLPGGSEPHPEGKDVTPGELLERESRLAASAGSKSNRDARSSRVALTAAQNWRRPPLVWDETSPYHGELGASPIHIRGGAVLGGRGSSCGADTSMSLRNP